jgi:putative glycosyltransferase (TIGR04372 family)
MAVPVAFGVPVILTNILPPRLWPLRRHSLLFPKLLRDADSGALVPFSRLNDFGLFTYDFYKAMEWDEPAKYATHNLVPIDNTSADIAAACEDMIGFLEGRPISAEAREIQGIYKRKYCTTTPDAIEHGPDLVPSFAVKYADIIVN